MKETANPTQALRCNSAVASHVGKVRELNEDAVLDRPQTGLWAVADGMGGHENGDRASRMTVDALGSLQRDGPFDGLVQSVDTLLHEVNGLLRQEQQRGTGAISGTTVAVLLIGDGRGVVVWAGDSRVYRFRDGRLEAISRDHSQVEEWVAKGLLKRSQAAGHPASNQITRALGAAEDIDLESRPVDVAPGDMFLLCSDGLYNEIGEGEMERLLGGSGDCRVAAERLMARALEGEARDNISVVVVQVQHPQDTTQTLINPAFVQRLDMAPE